MANEQQPAGPYRADTLNVRDEDLVFAREFGTNITENTGDAFVTTAAPEANPTASINGRLGMLDVNSLAISELAEPRGQSFLLPAWDTLPPSPFIGPDATAMVVYAHLLYRQEPLGEVSIDKFADFILGTDGLIGHAPTVPFVTASIVGINGPIPPPTNPARIDLAEWATGPGGPIDDIQGDNWGRDLYWRFLLVNDTIKGTEIFADVSQAGLAWSQIGPASLQGEELRRIGLAVRGFCLASLDWVRAYSWVITGENAFLLPLPPQTGDRLFIP